MTTVKADRGLAKAQSQQEEIFYGSPMAIVGLFVDVVRARFSGDAGASLPWQWKTDPLPGEDENNEPRTDDGGSPRTLYIESAYVDDPEARSFRPAIYIDKDETTMTKTVIGNRSGYIQHNGIETFWAVCLMPIQIRCVSDVRGESAQLGDFVWFHLLACKDLVRETYKIHELSPPVLGKTVPYTRDAGPKAWETAISFTAQVEFRWKTQPIAPLLESVKQVIRTRGDGDSTVGAIITATTPMSRK